MWITVYTGDNYMLTPRLECIVEKVTADTAADIGTDHAYVAIELIKTGRARRVIAADVRKGPLEIARANIEKNNMSDRIDTRLGSGLSVLRHGECDTVIIAGMGGELISELIFADEDISRNTKLILQPMNAQYELRQKLLENHFKILEEDIECEGNRVYNIITAINGEGAPFERDIDYHIPPSLYTHKKFKALYDKKHREFLKIIRGLENSKNCDEDKLCYYRERLSDLEKIK